ncbi:MAG TPA: chemotaxis protein CheB [Gammaproteobacteria bacterium]|nr:chemotaxis protein CheB [Gammaproteobacteria bacterium]
MSGKTIIVVGASAGGLTALRTLVAGMPADLAAPVCIVLHIGRHKSELAAILGRVGPLPVAEAEDGARLADGHIYVAPSDRHLLIADDHIHLTRGPKENFARPAIDPLFRSAAEIYGAGAIGVILSGFLNDGTAGLYEIKRRGGTSVVQTPRDAEHPDMPQSALAHVEVDHCVPVADMPALLARLAATGTVEITEEVAPMTANETLERPVALTCPDCGGALRREEIGTLTKYRCHIGHSYTAETMATGQFTEMERGIETALRCVRERMEMCRQMAERPGAPDGREGWQAAMRQAEERAGEMEAFLRRDWLAPEA